MNTGNPKNKFTFIATFEENPEKGIKWSLLRTGVNEVSDDSNRALWEAARLVKDTADWEQFPEQDESLNPRQARPEHGFIRIGFASREKGRAMSQKRKSQDREAPAYQEYAANMMARIEYRAMTLQDRGLFDTMRRECWVNKRLPANPDLLGKVLGFPEQQISDSLPAVMSFFGVSDGYIFCPELDNYRNYLNEIREAQSGGGKTGAAITNGKKKLRKNRMDIDDSSDLSSNPSSESQVNQRVSRESTRKVLVQLNPIQSSPNQSTRKEKVIDPFVDAMESEEAKISKIVRRTV